MRNALLIAAGALALTACASKPAAEKPPAPSMSERVEETRRGVGKAAVTPLEDIGLVRPDIPKVLAELKYPYETQSLGGSCAQVAYQIGQLDAVLGAENYQPSGGDQGLVDKGFDAAGDAVVGAAQDAVNIVPFRSWVRRASGANTAARRALQAVELGHTRRSFLRGYGASLGCPNVLPAPPPRPGMPQQKPETVRVAPP